MVRITTKTGSSPVKLAAGLQDLTFAATNSEGENSQAWVFDYADPLFHKRRQFSAIPRDGLFSLQWHLHNNGSQGGRPGADIQAPEAWDITKGHESIRVAVIDDGFELEHSDFDENLLVAPYNAQSASGDPRPTPGADDCHGTSVLGLVSAAHNGRGACGVAPNCADIPIKLEALADDDAEARAFDHAVSQGAVVINCSWGPADGVSVRRWPVPRIVDIVIQHAKNQDVSVVFAAGNGGESISSDGFGGASAAAPLVSGVIALMQSATLRNMEALAVYQWTNSNLC